MDFVRNAGLRPPRWAGDENELLEQWTYKARSANTKHLDLQFTSEVVERPPIGEWSESDRRPVSI